MTYFSNATENGCFEVFYCSKCAHEGDHENTGCAVMDAHFIFNGDQLTDGKPNKIGELLEMLIATDGAHPGKCKMFYKKPPVDLTRDMFEEAEK